MPIHAEPFQRLGGDSGHLIHCVICPPTQRCDKPGEEAVERAMRVSHKGILELNCFEVGGIMKGCDHPNRPAHTCAVFGLFGGVVSSHIKALWELSLLQSRAMELPREHRRLGVGTMCSIFQSCCNAPLVLTSDGCTSIIVFATGL